MITKCANNVVKQFNISAIYSSERRSNILFMIQLEEMLDVSQRSTEVNFKKPQLTLSYIYKYGDAQQQPLLCQSEEQ